MEPSRGTESIWKTLYGELYKPRCGGLPSLLNACSFGLFLGKWVTLVNGSIFAMANKKLRTKFVPQYYTHTHTFRFVDIFPSLKVLMDYRLGNVLEHK